MDHMTRFAAHVLLAGIIAAVTVIGYLTLFVTIARHPLTTAAGAAVVAAAGVCIWRVRALLDHWRTGPPPPDVDPDPVPDDAAVMHVITDELEAILGPGAYAELRALTAEHRNGS